jgi:prefoldin subunit 5
MPFAPFTFTKEQETQMLQQQMKALESQLDAIRNRMQELKKEK